jgi:C4-type Zn-finger protein
MDSQCPFCGGKELHHFSHWTASGFDYRGLIEVKKIQCKGCQAEAPERIWNSRAEPVTT